jgi:hypothetical protein
MTHFTVGIIVPQDKVPYIETYIYRQMEPYDERIEVDPYVCYSLDMAQAEIERDVSRLQRIVERQAQNYSLDKCRDRLAKLRVTTPEERYREYAQHHEHFNAQGEPLTTYNPDSKWDWWVIGGRWDGWITGNATAGRESVEDNLAPTEHAIERNIIPHAIITPDGQWHERGKLGWWAVLLTENEDWDAQAKEILFGYPGHSFVILDAHI